MKRLKYGKFYNKNSTDFKRTTTGIVPWYFKNSKKIIVKPVLFFKDYLMAVSVKAEATVKDLTRLMPKLAKRGRVYQGEPRRGKK